MTNPTRYELIDKDGNKHGPFDTLDRAVNFAETRWPDQSQDEDRTGKGWDIAVVTFAAPERN
jgi:hypothetical protein